MDLRETLWAWLEDTTSLERGDSFFLPNGDYECFPQIEDLHERLTAAMAPKPTESDIEPRVTYANGHLVIGLWEGTKLVRTLHLTAGNLSAACDELADFLSSYRRQTAVSRRTAAVWPDFIAAPQHEDTAEGWEDPALPNFRAIWEVAKKRGYAVGLHGSMKRDCDLIAVPWAEDHSAPEALIAQLARR